MNAIADLASWPLSMQIMAFILGILILGAAVVILISALKFLRSIKWKRLGPLEADTETPSAQDKKNPHATCGYVKDVIQVFRNRDDLKDLIAREKDHAAAEINRIKTRDLPKEIMQTAETAIRSAITCMESGYLKLLKESGIAEKKDVASTKQFEMYHVILRAMEPTMLNEARRMMQENGWIKKERENRFEAYVKEKIDSFQDKTTDLLNDYYFIDSPTRTELYDFNMKHMYDPEGVANIIASALRQFLLIAKVWEADIDKIQEECDAKVEVLQKRMDEEMQKILGDY